MDKYLMLLVCLAILGPAANGRAWGGYYNYPPKKTHHDFNYNSWCNSPGGWNDSWESGESGEDYNWNDDRARSTRKTSTSTSTTTRRNVVMSVSNAQGAITTDIRASSTGSTPSPIEVLLCLRLCPLTSEFNPVCGTDNITYRNPGRIECARTCGVSVSIQRFTACNASPTQMTPAPTTTPQPITPPSSTTTAPLSQLVFMACTRNCPVTSEYSPVCGTDNVTYDNLSRFECAKNCGKTSLAVMRPSRCNAPTPPPDPVTTTTTAQPQTTTTARSNPTTTQTSTSVPPTRFTTIDASASPNPLGQNTGVPSGGLGFTIPLNILEGIFNFTTESIPDYSVDERVGD